MDFKNLLAYNKSFDLAMKILEITKKNKKEEKYSLIDQIRRFSRSVTTNISESYRKRKYLKHFINKLTDSDSENAETQTWIEFSLACKYIDRKTFDQLTSLSLKVGNLINYMINNPKSLVSKNRLNH